MKRQFIFVTALLLIVQYSKAQTHLEHYIRMGLDSNQSIRQQSFLLEKNIYALKEARNLFLPNIGFNTAYTKAAGGRTIDIPLGDLLNQTYSTLNKLTNTGNFPQLTNQHILLNPNNYYDSKLTTTMPLLNAELIYNKRIKKQQVDIQRTEVALYKRELVKDIKNAYYQFAKASSSVAIYQSSLKLVLENKRINTALFNNDKVNRTAVIRSNNEVSKINAQLTNAIESRESARAYFNFLINKPLRDSIMMDSIDQLPGETVSATDEVNKREELKAFQIARNVNENITALNRAYLVPKIGTFLDLGSQAFDWKFNNSSRYYLFGVSLQWDIFSSGKNTNRIRQSLADQQRLEAENDYVEKELKMQLTLSRNAYQSAVANYNAAQSQLQTAGQYYRDELKLYKEGQALYIELLDAQNELINARLASNIALYDAWGKYADIERASASFSLN
jgi:outer membrane protein TolC